MKKRTTAIILAFLLGFIGIHKFYLGQQKKGVLYFIFSWTLIPGILALYEACQIIFMKDDIFTKQYEEKKTTYKAPKSIPGISLFISILLFGMIAIASGGDTSPSNTWDTQIKTTNKVEQEEKKESISDIVKKVHGKTRAEIEEMLGEPSDVFEATQQQIELDIDHSVTWELDEEYSLRGANFFDMNDPITSFTLQKISGDELPRKPIKSLGLNTLPSSIPVEEIEMRGKIYVVEIGDIVTERREKEARREMIESQFSAWDGSHRYFSELIKGVMNDPDSYEHVETTYIDEGETVLVQTEFRGKNAFGGVITDIMTARFTLDGKLVEIIEE